MKLTLGHSSNGNSAQKEVLLESHLFISYYQQQQIKFFFQELISSLQIISNRFLLICREENLLNFPPGVKPAIYVYDKPETGNIFRKSLVFSAPSQLLIKRLKQKTPDLDNYYIVIDDIWQLLPGLNKRSGNSFKQLLMEGPASNVFCLIAGTLPYRNLLKQLMQPDKKSFNSIGDEIIINPDDLIFFREKGQAEFESFYP